MLIFDLLKEVQSKRKFYKDKNEAFEMFLQQKKSIDAISGTKGFKEIKDFFIREVEACTGRLRTMHTEKDMFRVQGEMDLSMKFLDFLSNIQNSDIDKEAQDILNS